MKIIQYILIFVLISLFCGCQSEREHDVKRKIQQIKALPAPPTKPLLLNKIEKFSYPQQPTRNPFELHSFVKNTHTQESIPFLIKPEAQQPVQSSREKRVSLISQSIDIRTALTQLAEYNNVNLVLSDAVVGNISLRLHNVTWKQALEVILATQGLEMRLFGEIILIDKISTWAIKDSEALKLQQSMQKLEPQQAVVVQVKHAKAEDIARIIQDKNTSILPSENRLRVDIRTNSLLLYDTSSRIRDMMCLINKLDVPVRQVMIEARIVNVSRHFSKDLGVRLGVSKSNYLSGTMHGFNSLAHDTQMADVPVLQRLNVDLGAIPFEATPASVGISLAKLGNNLLLDLELSALESEGFAKIVASLKLLTTNLQSAVIESGEEIPYQETNTNGGTSVAFRKAVLSLKVTPQITPDGKLLMYLVINQDSDSGRRVQGVPIITTKVIETNVLVNNGQTIVLGGIYKQNKNKTLSRVPFLGSLPVIRHLFRRKEWRISKDELLIFMTPKIIIQ